MPRVFVDTVAWLALANTRDSLHDIASESFYRLWRSETSFVSSEFVLVELANGLSTTQFRARTHDFINSLIRSPSIEIVESSSDLFSRGLALYGRRPDKHWSLVDCTSFVIMTEREIREAFTQDHHFEQAGFVKLL